MSGPARAAWVAAVTLAAFACEPAAEIPFEAYEADDFTTTYLGPPAPGGRYVDLLSSTMLVIDGVPARVDFQYSAIGPDGSLGVFGFDGAQQDDGSWLLVEDSLRCRVDPEELRCVGSGVFESHYRRGGNNTASHTTRVFRFDPP